MAQENSVPTYGELITLTFAALKALGSGNDFEITAKVAELLPEGTLESPHFNSENWTAGLIWAKHILNKYGAISKNAENVWSITPEFSNIPEVDGEDLYRNYNKTKTFVKKRFNTDATDYFDRSKSFFIRMNQRIQDQPSPEYGLVPTKPIYTAFLEGKLNYLHSLRTIEGDILTWKETASLYVEGIFGAVDVYETYLPSGELYKTIYLNIYRDRTSSIPPEGFKMALDID